MKNKSIEYMHENRIPIKWDVLTVENKNKLIDDIVKKWGYARIISLNKKDILDGTTANAIKTIKDNLSKENKNKLLACNLYKTISITWKLIEKCKA